LEEKELAMIKKLRIKRFNQLRRSLRGAAIFTILFLLIEFFDEFHYGVMNAALPWLRAELSLSYEQVGLLLGLPGIISTFIEPVIMLLGDTSLRKRLIVGGGIAVLTSLVITAGAHSFLPLLVAMVIGFPASGAFVTLAQATLMDLNPGREPHMMARWTVAGSVGNLLGPLLLAGGFTIGLSWRHGYWVLALLGLPLVLLVLLHPFPQRTVDQEGDRQRIGALLTGLWESVRNLKLMRWIALLELSDLLLDVFSSYAALYFADVVGLNATQVSLLLGAMMLCGLLSDVVLIPLLERFPGRSIVRLSAMFVSVVYILWLLIPWLWAKIALVILIKLSTLGWYQVLQGEAYASAPGRSGTVMAVNSLAGPISGAMIWFVGWMAARFGLPAAMWLLLVGPVSLALFVPRVVRMSQTAFIDSS
jgi:MFS transporter, FSR family, fosmidomycin resistance protein